MIVIFDCQRGAGERLRKERQYERGKKTGSSDEARPDDEITVIPIHGAKLTQKSFKLPTRLKDLLKEDGSDE